MQGSIFLSEPTRVLEAVRLELEAAGNPAYTVAVVDADGRAHPGPIVYSRREPAIAHARRMSVGEGETLVIVTREVVDRRARFTILDRTGATRLHEQLEVVESSLVQDDPFVGTV